MHSHILSSHRSASIRLAAASAVLLLVLAGASWNAEAATSGTITVTATNSDGKNTGTARLGVPVNLTTAVSGTNYRIIGWTLQGGGSLSESGVNAVNATYLPPVTMPSSSSVTIIAFLANHPSVRKSYVVQLVNPIPVISTNGASPAKLLTGGTQPVVLVGSGFVPSTYVEWNGTRLSTTYTSYNKVTVHVPVSGTATGKLSMQVRNSIPGGGWGTTFTETLDTDSIALTASNAAGTNTGTAQLASKVSMKAAVSGSAATAVTWSVSGAGSISSSGVYSAPSAMPSSNKVVIKSTLASNPAITASYSMSILNPVPTIANAVPERLPSGQTTAVTLIGTGFVPGTIVTAGGSKISATYKSSTSMIVNVPVASGKTGTLGLQAQNSAPGGGDSYTFDESIAGVITPTAAARILDQTTFGPTTALIQHVENEGIAVWLAEQFNSPTTLLATLPATLPSYCSTAAFCAESEWWKTVLTGNDQLRQRVAFAMNEQFVISSESVAGPAIVSYANMLANDAFTNWFTIMHDVTVSTAMGQYLNMLNSSKATGKEIANENYARENMQLFNLGVYLLNQDGSLKLDANGNPQPTYTQAQVQAFARVFTGWTFANTDGSKPTWLIDNGNYNHPMVAVEAYHDEGSKTLLEGTILPAGQTAEEDLQGALLNIFNHPNLPPFVCKQLIQHLVTGNPSHAYISRVASVFINDGNGVRGDMTAVLRAIFTDVEARVGDVDSTALGGHLREPILYMTAVMRGLGYVNIDPHNYYRNLSNYSSTLGQYPFGASSVFGFFPPGYVIPAVDLGGSVTSPEFALENTGSVVGRLTLASQLASNGITSFNVDLSSTSPLGQQSWSSAGLVDALAALFLHSNIDPDTRAAIIAAILPLTSRAERVQVATYLVISSSAYKIMH